MYVMFWLILDYLVKVNQRQPCASSVLGLFSCKYYPKKALCTIFRIQDYHEQGSGKLSLNALSILGFHARIRQRKNHVLKTIILQGTAKESHMFWKLGYLAMIKLSFLIWELVYLTRICLKILLKNIVLRTFGTSQGVASLNCYIDIIYSEYVGGEQIRKLQGIVCLENSGYLAMISQTKPGGVLGNKKN